MKKLLTLSLFLLFLSNTSLAQTPLSQKGLTLKGILIMNTNVYSTLADLGDTTKITTRFEKLTFVFVFAIDSLKHKNDYKRYYQVGQSPEKIDGWIPQSALLIWQHRVCLRLLPKKSPRYTVDTTGAVKIKHQVAREETKTVKSTLIFNTYEDAIKKNHYTVKKIFSPYHRDYFDYNDVIFPILEERRSKNNPKQKIYKIAYLNTSSSQDATRSDSLYFDTGWIREYDTQENLQVEPCLFLTRDELNLYIWYMQVALVTSASDSEGFIQNIANQVSVMLGSEYVSSFELEAHVQKRLYLPKKDNSLLQFPIEEVLTWSETQKKNAIRMFRTKRKNLDDYLSDTSNWRKPRGYGFELTFVPLEMLP